MTPWELSQITERARAKDDRRRVRRLLHRGRLTEYLNRPCPYCRIAMTNWNGRKIGERQAVITAFRESTTSPTSSLFENGPERNWIVEPTPQAKPLFC